MGGERVGVGRCAGLAALPWVALGVFLVASRAVAAEDGASILPAAAPASMIEAEIAHLNDKIGQASVPGEEQIGLAWRTRDALDEALRGVEAAAAQAAGRRRDTELLLSAVIGRAARESRLRRAEGRAEAGAGAQRLGAALVAAGQAVRAAEAEVDRHLFTARRIAALAGAANRQLQRLRDDRARLLAARAGFEVRLAEAELALSLVPPPAPPAAAAPEHSLEPASTLRLALEPPWMPMAVAAEGLIAKVDGATGPMPEPAAGAAEGAVGGGVPDLAHLALLAPDSGPAALPDLVEPWPEPPRGWPIAGEVSRGFDETGLGPLDRGLTIVSNRQQPVRAPRGGTIVFAGPFMSFGPLLIVDHGHEYHSLLAGVARLDVRVGDVVLAGQIVGSIVGSEAVPARLYLELRHNGRPVNPLPWLAAHKDKVRG